MTKEQKTHNILVAKAQAFEDVSDLLLRLDSHRNFHRRVKEVVALCEQQCRRIMDAPAKPSEGFTCACPGCEQCLGGCAHVAVEQCVRTADGETLMLCAECATACLGNNVVRLVESEPTEQI